MSVAAARRPLDAAFPEAVDIERMPSPNDDDRQRRMQQQLDPTAELRSSDDSSSKAKPVGVGRVRFRVEPTRLEEATTPVATDENSMLESGFGQENVYTDGSGYEDGSRLYRLHPPPQQQQQQPSNPPNLELPLQHPSRNGISSSDSLNSLTRSSASFCVKTAPTVSLVDSLPPYVTVRLTSDTPAPSIPLSWMRDGNSVRGGGSLRSAVATSSSWRSLNKSLSCAGGVGNAGLPVGGASGAAGNTASGTPSGSGSTSSGPLRQLLLSSASREAVSGGRTAQQSQLYTTKHVHTEHVLSKHALKVKLNKYQRLLDSFFAAIHSAMADESGLNDALIVDAFTMVTQVFADSWSSPRLGLDLAYGLCDYVREMTYFDTIVKLYLDAEASAVVREAAALALEHCFSYPNRDYLISRCGLLEPFVQVAKTFTCGPLMRVSVALFESLFKQSVELNSRLVALSALDYVLNACKVCIDPQTFRPAACALANLCVYSDHECQMRMVERNVPDWLFLLASSDDDVTRYYACLAICALVANKEMEAAVIKSGTLSVVEPFLATQKPCEFAAVDHKHRQGRRQEWVEKLLPMLSAKRREPRAVAAFHLAVEACIKKKQERTEILRKIGAVEALKQAAALPDELASKFASQALEIIGEDLPHKLSSQAPSWTVEDVQYWVSQIGFEVYATAFGQQRVDGDLLLQLTDSELENDIFMKSGLHRKRFFRELDSLKMAADYGSIDETRLDRFLVSIDPHFSVYTYKLLEMGVDSSILLSLNDETLRDCCGIINPVHRLKLLSAVEECRHVDDMEVAILSKHIDIFISYRRGTGNQLASLLKVLLQLRGHKVFIDVDRLSAGQFDTSLLKNIQAAKHFVLVLTPHALDRCVGDEECQDWVHKEVRCALEHNKNVVPVLDPQFEWPDEIQLPVQMRTVTRFNAVRWVHEYQDACVSKLEKFIQGETNVDRGFYPSIPPRAKFTSYNRTISRTNAPSSTTGNDVPEHALNNANCRVSNSKTEPGNVSVKSQPHNPLDSDWDYS